MVYGFQVIGIAVGAHEASTVSMGEALDRGCRRLNIESPARAHGHTAGVDADLLACGDDGADKIAGSESFDRLLAHEESTGESRGGHARPLIGAAARGVNREHGLISACDVVDESDAQGIEGVGFRQPEPRAVPFGAAACPGFDWDAACLESSRQRPARTIHGGRVFQGSLRLSLDLGMPEFIRGQCALGLIARVAGEREI